MTVDVADALADLPSGLRQDLLDAFNEIVRNYREHRWEPSELNGGKLCEAVFTVIDGYLDGRNYSARVKKPGRFPQACWELETKYQHVRDSHPPRVLIPRLMTGLYDIRNNRGVGHAGADVNPNQMDATVVLYMSKWLVAELVRLLHSLSTEEATDLVEALVEREQPWVWSHEAKRRVLRTGLTWKQQTLLLLLSEPHGVSESDLLRWLEHPSLGNFRKDVLRPLHKARMVEYDPDDRSVRLLPPGISEAEALVAPR